MNTNKQALLSFAMQAASIRLAYVSLPCGQVVSGSPRVGTALLGALGGCEVGVWEITPSVTTDIEVDEFFIVLCGAATVSFDDGTPALQLTAGSVGRLAQGAVSTWDVTETLRKVYLA